MKLIECYIESFGKLKDKRISFSDGLNCINDSNGAGKTTLSVFIKVMLFGMSDTKRASLEENDRKHYLPWDGSTAKGSLTFEVGGKEYRIERSFAAKPADDTFTLYDTSLGKVTEDFGENLGEELFGIDADGFERTVFLSERALTPRSENKSVSAKLSDLVGCDGDLGVMDEAMKRLEDGRKFYYKKGGSGELSNIKSRIIETRSRLEHLDEVARLAEEADERSKSLNSELSALYAKKRLLDAERESLAKAEAKIEIAKRYDELKEEVATLTEKKETLISFFGKGIPTYGEINGAELKLSEAVSLEGDGTVEESTEYRELSEYFKGTNDRQISEVKEAIFEMKRKKSIENSEEYASLNVMFSKRIPSHSELDELILATSKAPAASTKKTRVALLGMGTILSILGICLGILVNFAFFAVLAIGVVCLAIPFAVGGERREEALAKRISEFYASITDLPVPNEERYAFELARLKSSIDRATALKKETAASSAELCVSEFARMLSASDIDAVAFAELAVEKHDRFKALSLAENCKREERERRLTKARELRREASAFVSVYPTETDAPFTELRKKLGELERAESDIEAKLGEVKKIATSCPDVESEALPSRTLDEIANDSANCDERIAAAERERALTERMASEYSAELEAKDDTVLLLAELEESLKKHTENYNVILGTKDFLERAKDSMTAKYLGKTKSGFEKYTEIISGIPDERFEMSTDFGVTKLEGASAKVTEAYSRGTKDLYNLASRLALIDSLYEGETPFLILDDPFVSFDDERCKSALKLLRELGKIRQIIYFTCSESRAI